MCNLDTKYLDPRELFLQQHEKAPVSLQESRGSAKQRALHEDLSYLSPFLVAEQDLSRIPNQIG